MKYSIFSKFQSSLSFRSIECSWKRNRVFHVSSRKVHWHKQNCKDESYKGEERHETQTRYNIRPVFDLGCQDERTRFWTDKLHLFIRSFLGRSCYRDRWRRFIKGQVLFWVIIYDAFILRREVASFVAYFWSLFPDVASVVVLKKFEMSIERKLYDGQFIFIYFYGSFLLLSSPPTPPPCRSSKFDCPNAEANSSLMG